jgi:hypothetical protein
MFYSQAMGSSSHPRGLAVFFLFFSGTGSLTQASSRTTSRFRRGGSSLVSKFSCIYSLASAYCLGSNPWLHPPAVPVAVNRAGRSLQEVERAQVAPKQAPLELRTLCSTVPSHLYGPGPPLSPGPFRSRPIVEAPLARSTSPAPLMLRTRRVNHVPPSGVVERGG